VRGEQVAFHPIGEKLQGSLTFFTRYYPLPLGSQTMGNPLRQGVALNRLHLQGNTTAFQRTKPGAGLGHLVQTREHHDSQHVVIALRALGQLLQGHAAVFAGLATGDADFNNLFVSEQAQRAPRCQHFAPVKVSACYGM
jgi:hypothetical protein